MYIKYKIVPFCPYHFVRTILSSTILSAYHFVHTILSVPFCPLPFCPVTLPAVADSDIRLGRPHTCMFNIISLLFLRWSGPKSIAKLDRGAMAGFVPLDLPLAACGLELP